MFRQPLMAFAIAFLLFARPSLAQDAQDASIKQVILSETQSYFKKNQQAWASTWLQDPTTSRTFVSAYAYYHTNRWDSIMAQQAREFKRNSTPDSVEMTTDDFNIVKDGKLAVVDYKQTVKYLLYQPPFDLLISREHRVMMKKDGKWKIAEAITTNTNSYGDSTGEMSLNLAGYAFLSANKTDQAIQVLELNTKFFPDSYNVFDSLGEAYAKAGQKDMAIKNYQKSLELNPKSESAKKALKSLQ